MAEELVSQGIPIPEPLLRDLSKNPSRAFQDLASEDPTISINHLHSVIESVFETAESPDLVPAHRASAFNTLSAIIDKSQSLTEEHIRNAILDDSIWTRLLEIYLSKSENTKGKSSRQLLLTLTGVLVKTKSLRSEQLRNQAVSIFIDVINNRRDRMQVKPALQGLAYFLQKDVVSIGEFVHLYEPNVPGENEEVIPATQVVQDIMRKILSWVIHHDTALSAGQLWKHFLASLRRSNYEDLARKEPEPENWFGHVVFPLWIQPVAETLQAWRDRTQEFKTHVFPHCFLPNVDEFLRFLKYLDLDVRPKEPLPEAMGGPWPGMMGGMMGGMMPGMMGMGMGMGMREPPPEPRADRWSYHWHLLSTSKDSAILLAALQSGKEIGVITDVDGKKQTSIELQGNVLQIPDDFFCGLLSNPKPDVRIAGLDLSVYSTAVTRPFTSGVLSSLRQNLPHLHTEIDGNFRKEVLNNIHRLLDRLRGSTATIAKKAANKTSQEQDRIPFSEDCKKDRRRLLLPSDDALAEPFEFVLWYLHFVESELRSTASYQSRITALKVLSIMLKSGLDPDVPHRHLSKSAQGQLRWAHGLQITHPALLRSLFDLVLDPYDDVRSTAVSLLEICLDSVPVEKKATALSAIPQVIKRAEKMMLQTGRADQADGVARLWSLLFTQCNADLPEVLRTDSMGIWTKTGILNYLTTQLEETIEFARQDLASAVDGRPVHGTFAALRYILDQEGFYDGVSLLPRVEFQVGKGIHDRIRTCFESLWSCVQDVLCVDAPEGHVPEEFDEEASLDTKEVLSYSWRGLKEASILLRTMVSKAPIGTDDTSLLTPDDVKQLGKLCFLQLVELRHRGAHSTVAQTFAVFCRRCMTISDEELKALPEQWYEETLLCIQDKATAITRRSAGIPSLMTGIISAETQADGPLFKRAIKDLFAEASQDAQSTNITESRLPQVHALNSIKEIFTTSKLSEASEAYIADGLDLAARTLKSSIWPIRNCGLMLFKALIGRLLGSDETQDWKERNRTKTSRFSYERYPHLIGILKNLLDPNGPLRNSMDSTTDNSPMDLHGAEGVFPALQILRQAPPQDENREIITEFVLHLLSSPHWHLRDMAARTVVSLQRPDEYAGAIMMLLELLEGTTNNQHGVLLALKYMLGQYLRAYQDREADCTYGREPDELNAILADLKAKAPMFCGEDSCQFTKAAFIDLFNMCDLAVLHGHPGLELRHYSWSRLPSTLGIKIDHAEKGIQGDSLLRRAVNTCIILDLLAPTPSILSEFYEDEDEEYPEDEEYSEDEFDEAQELPDEDDEDADEDMDFGEMMAGMGEQASMEDIMAKLAEQGDMEQDDEEEELEAPSPEVHTVHVRSLLTDLATNDPDTCLDILTPIGDLILNADSAPLAIRKAQLLSHIHELMMKQKDAEVVSTCQSILAEALSLNHQGWKREFFEYLGKADVFDTIEKLQSQCLEGPPSIMQSALRLMGHFLDFAFCSYPKSRADVVPYIERYTRILSMTIVDTNPFDARFAAVRSMSALDDIWYSKHDPAETSKLRTGMYFVLYDMLNDDDDEIRDAAAVVASKLRLAHEVAGDMAEVEAKIQSQDSPLNQSAPHQQIPLQNHQMQLMLLEQLNKKRLLEIREQAEVQAKEERSESPDLPTNHQPAPQKLPDHIMNLMRLEQENKKRLLEARGQAEVQAEEERSESPDLPTNHQPAPHALEDYQMQLMLLEQPNKKQLLEASTPQKLQEYQTQLMLLEQANKKRLLEARGNCNEMPTIAVQSLGQYLSGPKANPEMVCKEALRRLTATPSDSKPFAQPFAETLAETRKEDTALFIHEKQNLYKDDVVDVTFWAKILQSIDPSKVPDSLSSDLKNWVMDALYHLTETAKEEVDGPLGWTNKAEVFTLGIRVIYGAEIVLGWKDAESSKILTLLRQLADVGMENELNGLWVEKIEGLIERSLVA